MTQNMGMGVGMGTALPFGSTGSVYIGPGSLLHNYVPGDRIDSHPNYAALTTLANWEPEAVSILFRTQEPGGGIWTGRAADYLVQDRQRVQLFIQSADKERQATVDSLVRYPPGAFAALADQSFATDSGTQTYTFPAATGANLTWTYSLVNPPAGVTIDSATRTISHDTTALAVQSYSVTVRATDQYGASITNTYTLTITAAVEGWVFVDNGDGTGTILNFPTPVTTPAWAFVDNGNGTGTITAYPGAT